MFRPSNSPCSLRLFRRALLPALLVVFTLSAPAAAQILINELDADTPGTDTAEFVEIYDGGVGNSSLTGYVLVFYNGSSDDSYAAFDLDGFTTDGDGYFVAGNAAVANVDLVFGGNLLQNGADAVALYLGDATSFPNGTAVSLTNLVDAVVYDTDDADDAGLLVLLQAGQPQVNENSNGNGATESSGRCPDGSGGPRMTSTYSQRAPTPGAANCAPAQALKIHQIQGTGSESTYVGVEVEVDGIVTGVKSNSFFLQEEDSDADEDAATSEGIVVFTGSAPPAAAAVGNRVLVTGTVSEFVPSADPLQPPLTEIVGPVVLLQAVGEPLPAAIPLTDVYPDPGDAFDQLEALEGMRVSVASLTVVGPTLGSVNEPNATATSNGVFYGVIEPNPRPFREPGVQEPDPAPIDVPRFDTNPERIRVDSDALVGAAVLNVGTGAVVTGLVGPLDYSFRAYTIDPDPASPPGTSGAPVPVAVAAPALDELTVAAFNLERFFDDVDDPSIGEPVLTTTAYSNRLAKASLAIRDYLRTPDILAVVECENLSTLEALAAQIDTDAAGAAQPLPEYAAYLVEGNDVGGIDVGFLVKTAEFLGGIPRVEVVSVVQEGADELVTNPNASTELLNDRPPLVLDAIVHHPSGVSFPVVAIANHLRSHGGVSDTSPGSNGWPTVGDRVRNKRQKQAEYLAGLVQDRQDSDPAEHLVLLGDFNAFEFNDGLVHSIGVIVGDPAADEATVVPGDGVDLVEPDLEILQAADTDERYSYVFDGNAQSLDHLLFSAPLLADTTARRVEHPRISADFPETDRNDYTPGNPRRLSDHDPLVGYFTVPVFTTTIFLDGFESENTGRWSQTNP